MTASGTRESRNLRDEYRATFQEYAAKLNTLQGLIDRDATGTDDFQAALDAVDAAHSAHSRARDCLAKELMRRTNSAGAGPEQQIRKTARLIWEFAGRPEGTAERDWQRAEKLVQSAAACC
jgi:hypothetical protein